MKTRGKEMKRIYRAGFVFALFAAVFLLTGAVFSLRSQAKDLDEIQNYEITVHVNDDATLTMHYRIDWKVLDSSTDGPLSWVIIGTPNFHYKSYKALTPNIKDIKYTADNGSGMKITFDRNYYMGEVISFEFEIVQDYMYQMNMVKQGETVYRFTPGWFDEIDVKKLVIRWDTDKVIAVSPEYQYDYDNSNPDNKAYVELDGYYIWTTSMKKGNHYTVEVTYPNDAYNFSKDKSIAKASNVIAAETKAFIIAIAVIAGSVGFIFLMKLIIDLVGWTNSAGFNRIEKKVVRTVIEYYPNCPNCGAPRPEGKENCEYCGTNFVKTEKVVEEKKVPKQYQNLKNEIFSHYDNGTYAIGSSPTTFVRVNTVNVRRRSSFASYVSEHSGSGGGSRGGGGCAHSSCACACACACAGGGRAGCSTKDFYNTNLKMKYFK